MLLGVGASLDDLPPVERPCMISLVPGECRGEAFFF
jgi:hypothetical protein